MNDALEHGASSTLRTLDGVDFRGKRVLVRVDLNVPMRDGRVTDASRIERIRPTVRELQAKGARVILCRALVHSGGPEAW